LRLYSYLKEKSENMKKKAGLVLEGGSERGVFTAGILDYFMEKNLYFPYVIGVSAGCCNAVDYVSKQPKRTKITMVDYHRVGSYTGIKYLVKKKSIFDMDVIFDLFPNALIPFDYNTYFNSKQECKIVTTNALTGKAEYLQEHESGKRLMNICRASCSIPIVSPVTMIDGIPMFDGGVSDSVPIRKAIKDGINRNVIILTRNKGYRKKPSPRALKAAIFLYGRKYPNLVKAIKYRYKMYNNTMDYIDYLEEKGRIFVLRPQIATVKNTETDADKLEAFYMHGYDYIKDEYDKMLSFLEGCEFV